MLQFNITLSKTEDITFEVFKLSSKGRGKENSTDKVLLIEDANKDGVYNSGDVKWGSSNFSIDDGNVRISVSKLVKAGVSKTFLIVYVMGKHEEGDTFTVTLNEIKAVGVTSTAEIGFSNLPLESGRSTVSAVEVEEIIEEVKAENKTANVSLEAAQTEQQKVSPTKFKKEKKSGGLGGTLLITLAVVGVFCMLFYVLTARDN